MDPSLFPLLIAHLRPDDLPRLLAFLDAYLAAREVVKALWPDREAHFHTRHPDYREDLAKVQPPRLHAAVEAFRQARLPLLTLCPALPEQWCRLPAYAGRLPRRPRKDDETLTPEEAAAEAAGAEEEAREVAAEAEMAAELRAFRDHVRAMAPAARTGAVPPQGVIWSLGGREYQVGITAQSVEHDEDRVLQAFLQRSAWETRELNAATGLDNAPRVLRQLCQKYGNLFDPCIRRPGRRGAGGYAATVRKRPSRRRG
jgi:hypothetical protein